MTPEEVMEYYSKLEVREEIAEYCRGRWVALECRGAGASRVFIRYWRDGSPLRISNPVDVTRLLQTYRGLGPRTIYATACKYKRLASTSDLEDPSNIAAATPVWDIDCGERDWKLALEAARIIVDFLEKHGVKESVYLLWSGMGLHVRVHEKAFSPELLAKHNPLDLAYSIVEYALRRLKDQLSKLASKAAEELKVENVMDAKRVFTAPLSLHREKDRVCVCFQPEDIDSFTLEWCDPGNPKHWREWKNAYLIGEADQLALEALREVGGYPGWPKRPAARHTRITKPGEEEVEGKVGRFQVMALLQAARYYLLKGDLEKAKSFGLNRAIFYAWAKHYGRTAKAARRHPAMGEHRASGVKLVKVIGDEEAPVSETGWFAMGGVEQRPEDYDRQVARRFEAAGIPYEKAWQAALEYLKRFPKTVLLDPQKFYEKAYLPVRDDFVDRVVLGKEKKKIKTLDELLGGKS